MKAAIVGASISGLYLGYLLAREGVEVEVYEKEDQGQAAKRTLIVTSKLKELLDFDVSESVLNIIDRYELITDGQRAAIELDNPELVIERKELLELLARQAETAGAKIFWGHEVVEIGKELKIINRESGEEKRIEREVVVLANGLNSNNLNGHNKLAIAQARVKNGDTNLFSIQANSSKTSLMGQIIARLCL